MLKKKKKVCTAVVSKVFSVRLACANLYSTLGSTAECNEFMAVFMYSVDSLDFSFITAAQTPLLPESHRKKKKRTNR